MKVLVLSHMYPNNIDSTYGIFVHQQVKALKQQGITVKVISPVPWAPKLLWFSKKWEKYGKLPMEDIKDGVKVYYPRYFILPRKILFEFFGYSHYWGMRDLVSEIYNQFEFDLIHAHVALPDGFAGSILKQKYKKPLITTIHGDDVNNIIYKNKRCKKNIIKTFKESDSIVANSSKTREKILTHYDVENKVSLVYNGIKANKIRKVVKENFKMNEKKEKQSEKVILSVASLRKLKGIDYALKALKEVNKSYSKFKYIIIGDGPEKENLKSLVESLDLEEKVRFLGRQPYNEVLKYMSACDMFVLPSWNEAFGMVYLEALAFGKPVIGCKGQGVEDIVDHGETGLLVNPKDIRDLKEKILTLLTDEDYCDQIGEKGKKKVLDKFTWEQSARKLINIYKQLI